MIADLKPYLDYRDSGLPWLGKVPGHWETRRLKSGVVNVNDQASGLEDGEVYIALEHVSSWTGHTRPQTDTRLFTGNVKRFRRGDVLFGKLRPYLAKVASAEVPGGCAGEFFVLRTTDPDRLSPGYLERLLRAKSMIDVINSSTFGAKMPRADWQFCGNLVLPLPPPPEQAAIVRFLTWANGRLERAIRAKRKVIALLNEQKQAIIHRAVTRGLDPSVPLKPSGIPWLGEIPAHWEVRRLKSLVTEAVAGPYGSSLTKAMYSASGYRVYGQQQVIPDNFQIGDYYIPSDLFFAMERYRVFPDDVLVSVMGTVGKVAVVPHSAEPGIINPRLVRFRPDLAQVRSRWLQLAIQDRGSQAQLLQAAKGTTMDGLNLRILGKLLILRPPLKEQDSVLSHIFAEQEPFSAAISRLTREIDLLHEYRTRLVSDVVTGKLDVRGVAAGLPEEVLEQEAGELLELAVEDEEEVG